MDNAVHTFEQLVQQSLDGHSEEDLCKTIQRCQDRVLKVSVLVESLLCKAETAPGSLLYYKICEYHLHFLVVFVYDLQKYDYDSSTVRKKFFREALLQIIIPCMLKPLSPSCSPVGTRNQPLCDIWKCRCSKETMTRAHTRVCVCVCIYIYICYEVAYTCVCIYVCIYMCVCVYIYIYIYVYMCVCLFTYYYELGNLLLKCIDLLLIIILMLMMIIVFVTI